MLPKQGEVFTQPENPRCPLKLFKLYLSLVPADGPFYKRPKKETAISSGPAFSSQNVGVHTLQKYLRNMCLAAKIDISDRNITGHSGKVTLCTRLYNKAFEEQVVKMKSGHQSDVVRKYKRPGLELRESVSNAALLPIAKRRL